MAVIGRMIHDPKQAQNKCRGVERSVLGSTWPPADWSSHAWLFHEYPKRLDSSTPLDFWKPSSHPQHNKAPLPRSWRKKFDTRGGRVAKICVGFATEGRGRHFCSLWQEGYTEIATSVTHRCTSASHMELPSVPLTPLTPLGVLLLFSALTLCSWSGLEGCWKGLEGRRRSLRPDSFSCCCTRAHFGRFMKHWLSVSISVAN